MGRRKKDPTKHILCSKLYFNKTANTNKKKEIIDFISEYQSLSLVLCDYLWDHPEIESLSFLNLTKELTQFLKEKSKTTLTSRAFQCCYKQTLGIIKGTIKKYKQRIFVYSKLLKEGKTKEAEKLKKIIDKNPISKPNVSHINPLLSEQLVVFNIGKENKTSFDFWMKLSAFTTKKRTKKESKICLPLNRNKHFNNLLKIGKLGKSVILTENCIQFSFEIEVVPKKETGKTEGVDIGILSPLTMSSGVQFKNISSNFEKSYNQNSKPIKEFKTKDEIIQQEKSVASFDYYNLKKILTELSRKKSGSKAFERKKIELKNYMNFIFKMLNKYCKENNIKTLNVEDIKRIKFGKRVNRMLKHWSATNFRLQFQRLMLNSGVQINFISPTYTSQRCGSCGWTQKANRKGIVFQCRHCGFTANADLNAARNISLSLPAIKKEDRQKQINKKGFFWSVFGQELIVPDKSKSLNTEYFSIV